MTASACQADEFSSLIVKFVLFMAKKINHENTKYGKHEILIFSFSSFRTFVLS